MSDYDDEELDSDDDEMPTDLKTKRSMPKKQNTSKNEIPIDRDMENYFEQMEQELAGTTMISSFEKVPCKVSHGFLFFL